VLGSRAEADPFITEPSLDAIRDHRLQNAAAGFETDAMLEVTARPHLLQSEEIAAFVMHTRKPITHELL
jgi:hypothetical protein